ncbi:MAG: hypothetical protein U0353_14945 [Sandaracinus sp.]
MPVPFVFRVRGSVRGVAFVSDGSVLTRADLVAAVPDPAGVKDIPSETLESLLQIPRGARVTPLAELVASRVWPGAFRTPDDVALADKYVWLVGSLGRDLTLHTTTPTSPVVVAEGVRVLGTVMPIVVAPEIGTHLPPPPAGAIRARISAYTREQGHARASTPDGREITIDVSVMSETLVKQAAPHALVDLELVSPQAPLRARRAWIAGAASASPSTAPSPAARPVPRAIDAAGAFDAAQHLRLLGEYDHGTWARLLSEHVDFEHGNVPKTITEHELRDLLLAARSSSRVDRSSSPRAGHTSGGAAEAEGIFALDPSRAQPEGVLAALRSFAASHGVRDVSIEAPLDIRAIHASLGRAFARAGSPLRVYLVGEQAPFVMIRERLEAIGPFAPVRAFVPEAPITPATLDPDAFLQAYAGSIAGPQARVERLASMDVAATRVSPPHTVHVLRRTALSGGAESFFLVTTGLASKPLPHGGPDALRLAELTTWTSRYDAELASTLSQIGVTLHALASEGARLELGHAIATDERGFMGWPRVLLSRFVAPIPTPLGRVDVARVTPITNEEWASKQRLGLDVLGGEPFVRGLESKGIPALLGRWYAPPPRA